MATHLAGIVSSRTRIWTKKEIFSQQNLLNKKGGKRLYKHFVIQLGGPFEIELQILTDWKQRAQLATAKGIDCFKLETNMGHSVATVRKFMRWLVAL